MRVYVQDTHNLKSLSKHIADFSQNLDRIFEDKAVRVSATRPSGIDGEGWREVHIYLKEINRIKPHLSEVRPSSLLSHVSKYQGGSVLMKLTDFIEKAFSDLSKGIKEQYGHKSKGVKIDRATVEIKRPRESYDITLVYEWHNTGKTRDE